MDRKYNLQRVQSFNLVGIIQYPFLSILLQTYLQSCVTTTLWYCRRLTAISMSRCSRGAAGIVIVYQMVVIQPSKRCRQCSSTSPALGFHGPIAILMPVESIRMQYIKYDNRVDILLWNNQLSKHYNITRGESYGSGV